MRVCDFCREPRSLSEIIIPEITYLYPGNLKVPCNNKHEICRECAMSLAKKLQEWMEESKNEN